MNVLNKAAFKFNFQKPIQNYKSDFVLHSLLSAVLCRYQMMKDFKKELEIALEKRDGIWKRIFG